jgi:DNA-binding CsgD family transcriptional regulator/tetratricopeptide (TPR) repeat protein
MSILGTTPLPALRFPPMLPGDMLTSVMDRWPLVGREAVLDHVATVLGQPERAGVVLVGPAGVGKTRLAMECCDIGDRAGFATAVVLASQSSAGIPFGALAQILPPIDQAAERGIAMLQQAREGLEDLAGDRPLLLVVDDAHQLDSASALLLHQLVQAQAAFVVMTVRSGEAVPDPVVALWKDGMAERLEVGPLARTAADDLIASALGGPVEGATLQSFWNVSQGNALFLREVVLSAVESGALGVQDGLWRFVGAVEPSARLTDLVERRVAGLAEDEVAALELVAFGEPVGVEIVGQLVGSQALEVLERKGLVVTERDDLRIQARLAHPLHGEVLRDRTPPDQARTVRRSLADAVESRGARRRGDVLRIAVWRLEADDDDSPERFAEAAQQAAFANDFGIALRLAERAFALSPGFTSALVLADVLYELGEVERTEAVLGEVGSLAAEDEQRGLHTILRASNLYWRLGREAEAHAVLDAALDVLEDPEWRREVEATHGVFETCAARPRDALARVEPLLAHQEGRAFVQASLAAVLGLPLVGRGQDAVELARVGRGAHIGLSDQLRLYERSLMLEIGESLAQSQLGELAASEASARRIYDQSLEDAESAGWTFSALALGVSLLEQGRAAEAGRWWKESAALFRAVQHRGPLRWALGGQLICQALLEDLEGAAETIAELDEVIGPHPARMHELEIVRGRAWTLLASGDAPGARALLAEGIEEAVAAGLDWEELVMRHEQVRMGGEPGAARERVEQLGAVVQGRLGALMAAHVAALADRDPDALGGAATGFQECGAMLLATEAATAAADVARTQGKARQATAWARTAAQAASACQGVRTPGLSETAGAAPLSRREREVALLAAGGATSREIAEKLFLSSRTVENHLSRVYVKLGISGRDELADAIG